MAAASHPAGEGRTIIVADDHRIVAEGIAALLVQAQWNVELVSDGAELLRRCSARDYTLAIIDLSMPRVDGIAVLRAARATALRTPLMVVSMHTEAEFVRRALAEGARAYVSKAMAVEDLHNAVNAISQGRQYVSPSIRLPATPRTLTERQLEIARLLGQGMRAKEVAYALGLSTRTVESHKYAAMQKFDVATVMDLIRALRSEGLIS